jgi:hypothetical protein
VAESKRSTARAVLFEQYKVPYVFTIESSVGLYLDMATLRTEVYNAVEWEKMGRDLSRGVYEFDNAIREYDETL